MHVAQINYAYDRSLKDPDAILDRYETLVGWSEALLEAGARRVTVGQRFHRDVDVVRGGVEYVFRNDRGDPFPRPWTRPGALHRAVCANAPDVLHVNGLIFPAQTWLLRRRLPPRVPLLAQDHAASPPRLSSATDWPRRLLSRRGLRAADGFLFTAREQADPWRTAGVIDERQTVYEILESSRSVRPLSRAEAQALSGMRGRPAALWVGRLNDNKDPLTVLAGFERVLGSLPDAHLTMVFQGDERLAEVRDRLAWSPALDAHVTLAGQVAADKIVAFYGAADVFVLGSHHEGSGYALLEALACGVVPVVTDIPPFRALTAAGRLGSLWVPGQPDAFAAAFLAALAGDRSGQTAAIKAHFERELSWKAVGRRAVAIYREAMERRR